MTWATRITLLRLILIIPFSICVVGYQFLGWGREWRFIAFWIFTVAAISDYLDGFLARHCGQQSELGALLDPIADKCLLLASLVLFGLCPVFFRTGEVGLPTWFTLVILGRDCLLLTGYLLLVKAKRVNVQIHPHWTGKCSTFFTFVALGAVLLSWGWLVGPTCGAGGILAVACTAVYVMDGWRQMRLAAAE